MTLRLVVNNDAARARGFHAAEALQFDHYRTAHARWNLTRDESDRQAAIAAHDAWALTVGGLPIQNPKLWGFN